MAKVVDKNFNVRKIYSDLERMDGCKVSIEMIIAPLKELITSPNVFLVTNIPLLK